MENHHFSQFFIGQIHYFYGHVQSQSLKLPEGTPWVPGCRVAASSISASEVTVEDEAPGYLGSTERRPRGVPCLKMVLEAVTIVWLVVLYSTIMIFYYPHYHHYNYHFSCCWVMNRNHRYWDLYRIQDDNLNDDSWFARNPRPDL